MAYVKTNWINGQAPALSAENLNKIEEGVYNNSVSVDYLLDEDTILIDKFTTPSHTYAASPNAGSSWWVHGDDMHAPSHPGYTPVGIIGASPGAQSSLVPAIIINYSAYGDRLAGYIRNWSTSQITDTVTIIILYIKTEHLNLV